MADGNQRLLENNSDPHRYSAMEMEDLKSAKSPLVDGEGQSSLRINKRALVVFFGVTTLAAAVIIVAVFVTLYSEKGSNEQASRLKRDNTAVTIEDVLSGVYNPSSYHVDWISDDEYMTRGPGGRLDIINPTENTSRTLLSAEETKDMGSKIYLSASKKWVIYPVDVKPEYRYSSYADYYIYNINTKNKFKIKANSKIQYVEWSPTQDSVVFIAENDMYYIKDVSQPDKIHTLTNSGKKHQIFNGVPDWVYQEEVLNSDHALYFSKDGSYLTYVQFNDSKVKDYVFSWYGDPSDEYISEHKIAYPKPGTGNPTVKVKIIDLTKLPSNPDIPPKASHIQPPAQMKDIEHYTVEIGWLTSTIFSIQWLNRDQNYSITQLCYILKGVINCDRLKGHTEMVKNGWVDDKYMLPIYQSEKAYYLVKYPFEQGLNGKFIHIGKVDIGTGKVTQITSGTWEVTDVLAFDDKNEILYFAATPSQAELSLRPAKRHIYSVSIQDKKQTCLSCNAPYAKDGQSGYFSAQFSKKGKWYVLHYLGPSIPWLRLYSTDPNNKKVVTLETNEFLKEKLSKVPGLDPQKRTKFVSVPGDNNVAINAKIVYPPNFDENKKYAVLFSVYGGPATQNVLENWGLGYETAYLSYNFDIIIVYVDARGTMGRGERYKHAVYYQLGRYEARDTIAVAKYMQDKSYVDRNKIGIWGWSYGGFLSSYILGSEKTKVFNLAMAVAPVADWHYYDSIYTERYMGLPKNNEKGYKESSVLPLVNKYKGLDYLIVHGTGDDNVHFQNSAQLVRKLTEAEIDYRVQFYPDKNHSLEGEGTSEHLYHLLTRFLTEKEHIKSVTTS